MNYIGNCKKYISDTIIEQIINFDGDVRPNPQDLIQTYKTNTIKKWIESNYDLSKLKWTMYYQCHLSEKFILPSLFRGDVQWWFVKLNPGDMFPCHVDLFENKKNFKRYWIACQDYKPGHIFLYGDRVLTDYQAGDIFEIDAINVYHGSANIGFKPKISLQISVTN